MNVLDFKLWLVRNGFTRKSLALYLGCTTETFRNYCTNERFPKVFCLALETIESRRIQGVLEL